jgi:hypothetical protein
VWRVSPGAPAAAGLRLTRSRSASSGAKPDGATQRQDRDDAALFVGGEFAASPAGDSYLAKWGCRPKAMAKESRL